MKTLLRVLPILALTMLWMGTAHAQTGTMGGNFVVCPSPGQNGFIQLQWAAANHAFPPGTVFQTVFNGGPINVTGTDATTGLPVQLAIGTSGGQFDPQQTVGFAQLQTVQAGHVYSFNLTFNGQSLAFSTIICQ